MTRKEFEELRGIFASAHASMDSITRHSDEMQRRLGALGARAELGATGEADRRQVDALAQATRELGKTGRVRNHKVEAIERELDLKGPGGADGPSVLNTARRLRETLSRLDEELRELLDNP